MTTIEQNKRIKIMKIVSWLLVVMLAFVAISIHNSTNTEINHLQEQLSVCRDWNNIFLKVIAEQKE